MVTTTVSLMLAALGSGSAPELNYTAPHLGATLTVEIDGAVTGSPAALLYSPQEVEVVLPQGTLELDPVGMIIVGSATVAGDGTAEFTLPLPAATNLAEAPFHLQAYVASGAGELTEAIHARLIGDRVYVGERAAAFGASDQLTVFSDPLQDFVFSVEYSGDPGEVAAPVFNANRSIGAFGLESSSVRVFDNIDGELLVAGGLPVADGPLFAHPDGESFFAKSNSLIARISFETGKVIDTVVIPGITSESYHWVVNDDATEAYVETRVGVRAALRRLDLVTGADLGVLDVGNADHTVVSQIEFEAGWVLVGSWVQSGSSAALTQFDFSGPTPFSIVSDLGITGADGFLAFPALGTVYAWNNSIPFFGPGGELFAMAKVALGATSTATPIASPVTAQGSSSIEMTDVQRSGPSTAWFARQCCMDPPSSDEAGSLWSFDALTDTWSATPDLVLFLGPYGLAVIRNGTSEHAYTTRLVPGPTLTPKLDLFDEASQVLGEIAFPEPGTEAFELFAVPIP